MAFGLGRKSVTLDDILNKVTESDILRYYLGITEVPCITNSPLREDKRPSFGLYSLNGTKIYYTDLSTGDKGGLFDLLGKLWGLTYKEVLYKIDDDLPKLQHNSTIISPHKTTIATMSSINNNEVHCKVREWRDYDIEYWKSYGVSLEWLKYAEVYPISHKIIIKDNHKYVLNADKLAYAFVEHKEGKVTLKIYQPLNTDGYKWCNKHDSSVISLWTKVPQTGKRI
ncbi:MAG: hypothetical protein HUJ56_05125 [Erysipelotrichaceae bacterium]|nr:hypothetical protein [Erysipelotrichaceae bacterium]